MHASFSCAYQGPPAQSRGVNNPIRDSFLKSARACLANKMKKEPVETLTEFIHPISPPFTDAGWENEKKILPKLGPFGGGGSPAIRLYKLEPVRERGLCVCFIFKFQVFTPSEQTGGRSSARQGGFKQTTLPAGLLREGGDLLFTPQPEEC